MESNRRTPVLYTFNGNSCWKFYEHNIHNTKGFCRVCIYQWTIVRCLAMEPYNKRCHCLGRHHTIWKHIAYKLSIHAQDIRASLSLHILAADKRISVYALCLCACVRAFEIWLDVRCVYRANDSTVLAHWFKYLIVMSSAVVVAARDNAAWHS